jgi:hypothetical protein
MLGARTPSSALSAKPNLAYIEPPGIADEASALPALRRLVFQLNQYLPSMATCS